MCVWGWGGGEIGKEVVGVIVKENRKSPYNSIHIKGTTHLCSNAFRLQAKMSFRKENEFRFKRQSCLPIYTCFVVHFMCEGKYKTTGHTPTLSAFTLKRKVVNHFIYDLTPNSSMREKMKRLDTYKIKWQEKIMAQFMYLKRLGHKKVHAPLPATHCNKLRHICSFTQRVCVGMCTWVLACVAASMCVWVCVWVCVCVYLCLCVCSCVFLCLCVNIWTRKTQSVPLGSVTLERKQLYVRT